MPLTAAAASYETQVNINIAENDKKMMGLILTVLADSIRSQDINLWTSLSAGEHIWRAAPFCREREGPVIGPSWPGIHQEEDEFRDK